MVLAEDSRCVVIMVVDESGRKPVGIGLRGIEEMCIASV